MTIIFGGQALLFQEPDHKDRELVKAMRAARAKWEGEGQPESGQGF